MKVISIGSQKGGVGKSTTTLNLAGCAIEKGLSVAILDADKQRSLEEWDEYRDVDIPLIVSIDPDKPNLKATLETAKSDGFDLVLIDTPPKHNSFTAEVARYSDLMILVTRPSALDLFALQRTINITSEINIETRVLINACASKRNGIEDSDVKGCRDFLSEDDVTIFKQALVDRTPIRRAQTAIKLITEFEPKGEAAREIRKVWKEVEEAL